MEENINNQIPSKSPGQANPPVTPTGSVPPTNPPPAPTVPPVVNTQPSATPPGASYPDLKSNKTLLFVILGIVLVVILGTIYVIVMGKNLTGTKAPIPSPSPIVEQPTITPTPTPPDDINSVEIPNPDIDFTPINQDLNQL